MGRWLTGAFVVFLALFSATLVLTGWAVYLPSVPMLALVAGAYAGTNRLVRRRLVRRYGSIEKALADERLGIPVTHLLPDDSPAPEGHDDPCVHDLPRGHPSRRR